MIKNDWSSMDWDFWMNMNGDASIMKFKDWDIVAKIGKLLHSKRICPSLEISFRVSRDGSLELWLMPAEKALTYNDATNERNKAAHFIKGALAMYEDKTSTPLVRTDHESLSES